MNTLLSPQLANFNQHVLSKYQIYNSIFMTLPFDTLFKTVVLLPLFAETCENGFKNKQDPTTIVDEFFSKYQSHLSNQQQVDLLFRFIQFIERQVVLFDAVEDAAFKDVQRLDGVGTLSHLIDNAQANKTISELKEYLNTFKVRIVLTAHPTQFYPGTVLGVITDLAEAIKKNDLQTITELLGQLGKTPFFKKQKPSPLDEAKNLVWYLKNVFYESFGDIYNRIKQDVFENESIDNSILSIGFWPGGDRDGNPFVTPEITLQVAKKLKESIIKKYIKDVKLLVRRLTFNGIRERIINLNIRLHNSLLDEENAIELNEMVSELEAIKKMLVEDHQSLYVSLVESLINKTVLFGYHFAHLDIRQDSRVHDGMFRSLVHEMSENGSTIFPDNFFELPVSDQKSLLANVEGNLEGIIFKNKESLEVVDTIKAIKSIQISNGEAACNRYIISNNQTTLNVLQLFAMLKLIAFNDDLTVDVVPLFETIADLEAAPAVMEELYTTSKYSSHLRNRGNKQTIMLGFSDGTKDGGYLMANWAIFKAKEALTKVSRQYGIEVIFFDGRGGPPARGGGKSHQFYASLGPTIEDKEIQITIQGQTISSNFGTLDSSRYNMEQLLSSGVTNHMSDRNQVLQNEDEKVLQDLADLSLKEYLAFKSHPKFISYLEEMSTLKYYAKTNIGSRPSKRGAAKELKLEDLRAIPFVGSWSQLKQNVPGFFGVGAALKHYENEGKFDEIVHLYNHSKFFRALIANSMMSLSKSFFDLTRYMSKDEKYGEFWDHIYNEYQESKRLMLKLTGFDTLMQDEPIAKASIAVRESIVLPLLTIQQYALKKIQELQKEKDSSQKEMQVFEKMVTRSLFGNINASRNSA